jgi:hypothetical protein
MAALLPASRPASGENFTLARFVLSHLRCSPPLLSDFRSRPDHCKQVLLEFFQAKGKKEKHAAPETALTGNTSAFPKSLFFCLFPP